jgi:hypothetical protein
VQHSQLTVVKTAHILPGCRHDRQACGQNQQDEYGHGLQVPYQFRTIMAYPCQFDSCPRMLFFSANGYTFQGTPIGYADVDNARKIRENAPAVAAWRPTKDGISPVSSPVSPSSPVIPDDVLTCGADPNAPKTCPGQNLMKKTKLFSCTDQCVSEARVPRKLRFGWRCGYCA